MKTSVTGIISHDLNGIVIGWDVGAEKIFGYSYSETLGSPISRLIPPDLLEEEAETLQRLVRMEQVAPFETKRLRKDGRPVSVLFAPSPVPDFTGKVVAITQVVCEGTEHQEAEPAPAKLLVDSTNGSAFQHPQQDRSLQIDTNPPTFEFPQTDSLPRLANLRALLEVLPNGVMLVDEQRLIVTVTTGAARMFGYRQEELLGQPIDLLFPGVLGDQRWCDPAQILKSPLALSIETDSDLTARRKDGNQFPAQVTLSSIRTLEGTFVLVTIVDVTERKATQEKLRESDARLREFAENLKDFLWISDPRIPKLIYASPAYERLWGRPLSTLYADFSQGIEGIHADDRERVRQHFFATVLEGNYDTEFRVVRPDGSIVWIRDRGFPIFDEHGELVRVTGIAEDITERKQAEEALQESEQKFRLMVECVPQLVWTCKPDGQCDFLNRQCLEYTGVPAAEQMDSGWKKQVHPDDLPVLENAWNTALATGSDFYTRYRFRRYDGDYRWFDVRAVPMRDSEGHIIKWFGTKIDIHEEYVLNEALQKYTARLKILADVSHAFSEAGMDLQETLRSMARKTVEVLGDDCMVRLLSDDGKWLNLSGGYSIEPEISELIRTLAGSVPFQKDERTLAGKVIREAQPLLLPAVDQEWLRTATAPVFGPLLDRLTVRSLIIAPMRLQGGVIGLLYVTRHRREWSAFDEDDLSLVQDLADRAALAVANVRLYREVQMELELRQETEKSLRESEEYFRRLFDEAAVPAIMGALDGHILKANHALCRFFDVPEDVLLTYTFRDVTYPEDLAMTEEALASLLSGAADSYQIEKRYVRAQGEVVWALVNCTLLRDTTGAPYRMIAQLQDITGRKRAEETLRKSEERFRATFEQAAVGIAHVALDGRWLLVNQKLCDILGYTHDELLGQRFEAVTHPDDLTADRAAAQQVLANTRHTVSLEKRYIRKDGSPVWVNTTGSLMREAGGEPQYFIVVIEDITRRRQAEEARRESESRFRSYFELGLIGAVITSPTKGFIEVNDQMCKTLGYSRSELLQLTWAELTHPNDLAADVANFNRVLAGEIDGYSMDKRFIRKDGQIIHATISGQCVRRTDGSMDYFMAVLQDITERKEAEHALRKSEARFRALVDASAQIVWTNANNGAAIEDSPSWCAFTGQTAEERRGFGWLDALHPEDRERISPLWQLAIETRMPIATEYRLRHSSGVWRWTAVRAIPLLDADGTMDGWVGMNIDITERKQAEDALRESQARLAGIINSAMDAVITVDETQNILLFNPAAAKMFRYQGEEMIGQPLDRLIPERVRSAHREHIRHFGQTGVSMRAMGALGALHGLRADAEEFPVEASISQVVVEGKKTYTVILRDITERQHAMHAIRALNAELEQRVKDRTAELTTLNKELEAFTYSVSHDLRAPLRNISGFIELFTKSVSQQLTAGPQRYLTIITEEAKRMGVLIDDLLAFSRIGRIELQKMDVNLTQLVQEIQTSLRLEMQGRDIAWHLGVLPTVYADRALLRQVLVNLMANALKFTRPRAQAKIEIGTKSTSADDPMVVVFVRDNGVGFDMKYVDKLFNVFQRLHRSDEFEGTGVGLANVQRIIHRHGGQVWVEAAVDQGATFFVALPHQGQGEIRDGHETHLTG